MDTRNAEYISSGYSDQSGAFDAEIASKEPPISKYPTSLLNILRKLRKERNIDELMAQRAGLDQLCGKEGLHSSSQYRASLTSKSSNTLHLILSP
jgi:hypothetical protein